MTDSATREWCWHDVDEEEAHGPFGDREEALADALEEHEVGAKVIVGRCGWLTAGDYAACGVDVEDALERMCDAAFDDGAGPPDDPAFSIPPARMDAAREALEGVLRAWAAEYVEAERWYVVRDSETVVLEEAR